MPGFKIQGVKVYLLGAVMAFGLMTAAGNKSLAQDITSFSHAQPVVFSGSLSTGLNFYQSNTTYPGMKPLSWYISGAPTLSIYGVQLPFSFYITDQSSVFSYPFTQFGVSPSYKWATLYLGYRNMTFSPFTLAGHTFLGAGVELHPGILRFGAMYGQFNKAVAEDTVHPLISSNGTYTYLNPSYSRVGYAFKLGIGSSKNYVDLSYLHAHDNANSLPYPPVKTPLTPAQNAVVGLSTHFSFGKHIIWQTDGAVSAYTNNTQDTTSVGTQKTVNEVKPFITLNSSTNLLSAVQSNLTYTQHYFSVGLNFRQIDPNFQSMGAYYFQTDVRDYTISPSVKLFKNKVLINGSIGLQQDNIKNLEVNSQTQTIYSINISANPSKVFGIDAQYYNYGILQQPQNTSGIDTGLVHMINSMVMLVPHLTFMKPGKVYSIVLTASEQNLDDLNPITSASDNNQNYYATLNTTISFTKSQLNISAGINYTDTKSLEFESAGENVLAGVNKLFNKTLNVGVNGNYGVNNLNGANNGFNVGARIYASYVIASNHQFGLSLGYTQNQSIDTAYRASFNQFIGSVSYSYHFTTAHKKAANSK